MPKPLDVHKSLPHSLRLCMSQPGLMPDLIYALQELAQLLHQLKTGGHKAIQCHSVHTDLKNTGHAQECASLIESASVTSRI